MDCDCSLTLFIIHDFSTLSRNKWDFLKFFFSASDHLSGFYVCVMIFAKNILILTTNHTGASK